MNIKKQAILFALAVLIAPSTLARCVSPPYTWHSTVKVGDWMVYDASISANLFNIIHLTYSARITMNITGVNSTGITTEVSNVTGPLASILGMDGSGNTSFIPSAIVVLPLEILAEKNWTMDNTTLEFTYLKESDYAKYWRGIEIREVDLASVQSFLPLGSSGILGSSTNLSTSYAKWDNTTGFFYEMFFFISGSIDTGGGMILPVSIAFDISMIDASANIASDINDRRDHSMDALFAWQEFIAGWGPVFILVATAVATFSILYVIRKGSEKKTRALETAKKTPEPAKKNSRSAKVAEKYRKKSK